ncbi:BON1-associated protein 2 [Manihot esculenta]|uniref:C2 domain-containing protein n=1 Tax=Manihot esculenta TaxID=3983 RepID=A0A2C9WIV3_MANES|nr:BON1-associated protein 2 [Manihot esculenta]OAY59854.1 hypothetical protein MANES_01G065300v8 [Manihot esculenta]
MEITIISAQGLKTNSSSPFSHRLRPFITITAYPLAASSCSDDNKRRIYSTRIDDQGGVNPTWGDKFYIPIDTAFLTNRYSCIYLELYTKRLIMGRVLLGWCQIPVTDIGFPPEGSVRHLSYRLLARDGTKGHGIVNLTVKLTDFSSVGSQRFSDLNSKKISQSGSTVIGIPEMVFSHLNTCQRLNFKVD